jgi:hypothetical protein
MAAGSKVAERAAATVRRLYEAEVHELVAQVVVENARLKKDYELIAQHLDRALLRIAALEQRVEGFIATNPYAIPRALSLDRTTG